MLSTVISALIVGWVLSWFDIDDLFVDFCKRHLKINAASSTWYVFCVIIGIIAYLL